MVIFVLTEKDLADEEISVIGVADSVENAQKVMDKYYGEYKLLNYRDIRDSGIEWEKTIEIEYKYPKHKSDFCKYEVTLQWLELNKL